MSYTIHYNIALETESCFRCGVIFAMPSELRKHCLDNGATFYCPNGHGQVYCRSRQKELEDAQRQLRESKCETLRERQLRELAEAVAAKLERKLKRVARGVCPCCKRSFQNLQAHMKTKHPEQLAEEPARG